MPKQWLNIPKKGEGETTLETKCSAKLQLTVLGLILLSFTATVPNTYSQTIDQTLDAAHNLLYNVLPLNIQKYNISQPQYSSTQNGVQEQYVNYNLQAQDKPVQVQCTFQNGRIYTVLVTAKNGSLIFLNSASNPLDAAKSVMTKYQSFLGGGSLNEMLGALNSLGTAKNATVTYGTVKLTVTKTPVETNFVWKHVLSDCEYSEVSLVFQGETAFMLGDMQSRYRMGDPKVSISKNEALTIAQKIVANYTYLGTSEDGTIVTIGGFNVSKQNMTANLAPLERDGKLYPTWKIEAPLQKAYPGHPRAFLVTIWADSGEFVKLETLSPGGAWQINLFDNPDTGDTTSKEDTNFADAVDLGFRILAVIIILVSVFVIWRSLRKRRNQQKLDK